MGPAAGMTITITTPIIITMHMIIHTQMDAVITTMMKMIRQTRAAAVADLCHSRLGELSGTPSGRPCPLKVVTTEMTGHIKNLSHEV